jgi:hypothetical protein
MIGRSGGRSLSLQPLNRILVANNGHGTPTQLADLLSISRRNFRSEGRP